jgi:hypothetical protein
MGPPAAGASEEWIRRRAWMLVFSWADTTYSRGAERHAMPRPGVEIENALGLGGEGQLAVQLS